MRVSDRIAELLTESQIKDVFMVTGGGSMHLNDALSRNSKLNVINIKIMGRFCKYTFNNY